MITRTPDVSSNIHLTCAETDSISAGSCGPLGAGLEGGFEEGGFELALPPLLLDVFCFDFGGTSLIGGPCLKNQSKTELGLIS